MTLKGEYREGQGMMGGLCNTVILKSINFATKCLMETNFEVFSGCRFYIDEVLADNCRQLLETYGGEVVEEFSRERVTHIISVKKDHYDDNLCRSFKPIVHEEWLINCLAAGHLIELDPYALGPFCGFLSAKRTIRNKLARSFSKEKKSRRKKRRIRKKKKKIRTRRSHKYGSKKKSRFKIFNREIEAIISSKRKYGNLQYEILFKLPVSFEELIRKPKLEKQRIKWVSRQDLIMAGCRELLSSFVQKKSFERMVKKAAKYRDSCVQMYKDRLEAYLKFKGQYLAITNEGKILYRGRKRSFVEGKVADYQRIYKVKRSDPITPLIVKVGEENKTLFKEVRKDVRFSEFSEDSCMYPTCKCTLFRKKLKRKRGVKPKLHHVGRMKCGGMEVTMIQDLGSIDGSLVLDLILKLNLIPVNFERVNDVVLPVFVCDVFLDGLVSRLRFHPGKACTLGMGVLKNYEMKIDFLSNTNIVKAKKGIMRIRNMKRIARN